jgi:hypothetical protein
MTDTHGIITVKATRYSFPGLIQLRPQLMCGYSAVSGMSQRTADGRTLSLPFFALDRPSGRCFPARYHDDAVHPEDASAGTVSNRHVVTGHQHHRPDVSRDR